MKNIHVRVRFSCTTHGLFKVFVIFNLCIFLWSAIIVALSIVCLALKYLHITISPQQQCLCKISFILTHTWLWCHIFCVCHICYGSTPACDSIPIPIHPTFSTAVILPSEMAFFYLWRFETALNLIRFLWPIPSELPKWQKWQYLTIAKIAPSASIVLHCWYFLFMKICHSLKSY